jgi:PAS domain S-box-containing protein
MPPWRPRIEQQALPLRRWALGILGVLFFHASFTWAGDPEKLWLPGLGLGIALVSWFEAWILPALFLDVMVLRSVGGAPVPLAGMESGLYMAQIAASWYLYRHVARGSRWLEDPRSATVFLLIVGGAVAGSAALLHALLQTSQSDFDRGLIDFSLLASQHWLSRVLGVFAVAPFCLVVAAPILMRLRALDEPRHKPFGSTEWTAGDALEVAGISLGNAILSMLLVMLHMEQHGAGQGWTLWGGSLLLLVWVAVRQGLRGAVTIALVGATAGFLAILHQDPSEAVIASLQGNFVAETSLALLVGTSIGWVRASEARFRHVVGRIPVVLYSVRLPRGIAGAADRGTRGGRDHHVGPEIAAEAEIVLVSSASRDILGTSPESLMGAFRHWFERIYPEDHEILLAALTQLCLQRQPVTCEYRLVPKHEPSSADIDVQAPARPKQRTPPQPVYRWVRDTLAPHYTGDGRLDGWDGVVENITDQRQLAQDLRRTTSLLQAVVANLPTGVYFVRGPLGLPILVNARARHLLGQREDMSAALPHIPSVYRLHKPDGREYPYEELPVSVALQQGKSAMANDIIVHRPDGRKIAIISWAAPVDMAGNGKPDAAVWVLEDLTAVQKAEISRRESENRLRAVIETMAEGVILQNHTGHVLEGNPAACSILGFKHEELVQRRWLAPEQGALAEDGSPLSADAHPDRLALKRNQPVRNIVLGLPKADGTVWLLVNSLPLPPLTTLGSNAAMARLVTTFADITELVVARRRNDALQHELQLSRRLDLVGKLASGAVHDFNNQLTCMIGLASVARNELPDDHPARTELNRLIDIGQYASQLVGQILSFSKKQRVELTRVDLNVVVCFTLKLLEGILPPTIKVEKDLSQDDCWILADETQIQQVVTNLCLNARDAMPKGGTLRIVTRSEAINGKARVGLSIADTGIGMDDEVRLRVFEPFFTTKLAGTGLGLAVVQQIVHNLGGAIEVHSAPGQGSRFDIWFNEAQRE